MTPLSEPWFVYIVRCSDDTLYTGATNNVERRIEKHNSGKGAKYTKKRRPVTLLKSWEFPSKSDAMKEEYRIKQLSRDEKLKLIK
jgi:putative endonuclease